MVERGVALVDWKRRWGRVCGRWHRWCGEGGGGWRSEEE